ncbi:MAG: hypothetical protein K6E72_01695 [Saccharofermentans sp.]|nr:hypothetical protein [Saccharofermentans sp.]
MNRNDTMKFLNNYLEAKQWKNKDFGNYSKNSWNCSNKKKLIEHKADIKYDGPETHMLLFYFWPFLVLVPLGLYFVFLFLRKSDPDLLSQVELQLNNLAHDYVQLIILIIFYLIITVLFSKILQEINKIKVKKFKDDFELRKQEAKREAEREAKREAKMVSFQHKMLANQMRLIIDETEDALGNKDSYKEKYNTEKIIELIEYGGLTEPVASV